MKTISAVLLAVVVGLLSVTAFAAVSQAFAGTTTTQQTYSGSNTTGSYGYNGGCGGMMGGYYGGDMMGHGGCCNGGWHP